MNPMPTDLQLDALREVANIGCGQAASALSRLVGGQRVDIGVPRAFLTDGDDLLDVVGGADAQVVAASVGVEGDLSGRLLLVLSEVDAQRLVGLLLNAPGDNGLRDDHRSAFTETANILASACLTAIGKLANMKLMPSVPALVEDLASSVVDQVLSQIERSNQGKVVVLEARFTTAASEPIEGHMLVITDVPSLKRLLERLGV